MKYFTINELTKSDTAKRLGIDNTPTPEAVAAMTALIDKVLDPIRERWGAPIIVNSGYRSLLLNKAIGGAQASQHCKGQAADITTGIIGSNRVLFDLIRTMRKDKEIMFDQLIDEKGMSWIHISYVAGGPNRRQILKL